MKKYLKLLRINQWLKNFFLLAPLLFSFTIPSLNQIINLILGFLGFSFVASSIYIINDWKDIESDKLHPKKKNRPLAAGLISKSEATVCFICLLIFGLSLYIFILNNYIATTLLLFYFFLNLAYCFELKQIAIIDTIIVASGFVIRLFIGSIIADISLSHWIILLTFLLALLLVIGKRRNDIQILDTTGKSMRKSLIGYNAEFLNSIIIIIVSAILISYLLYTFSDDVISRNGEYLYLTSIFVMVGLFRYLQAIFVFKNSDSPTGMLIKDHFLQITIVLWALSFISIAVIHKYYGLQ